MILLKDATRDDFEVGQKVKTNGDGRNLSSAWRVCTILAIHDDYIETSLEDGGGWNVGFSRCDGKAEIEFLDEKGKAIKEQTKVDLEKLEALVLNESAKQEIVALLKQHEHGTKLFEEWGLGETIEYGKGMTFLFHGGPGCLSADTIVQINRAGKSFSIRLDELYFSFNGGKSDKGKVSGWDKNIITTIRANVDGHIRLVKLNLVLSSGVKELFEVKTLGGRSVKASAEHPFLTTKGWKQAKDLSSQDVLVVEGTQRTRGRIPKPRYIQINHLNNHPYCSDKKHSYAVPYHRLVAEAKANNLLTDTFIEKINNNDLDGLLFLDPKELAVHHKNSDTKDNRIENLQIMTHRDHHVLHSKETWKNVAYKTATDQIVSVERIGKEETYDLTVEGEDPNFLANGVVVHNTGKTWGANCIAKSLGKKLSVISAAEIQSSEPGGANRAIQAAFRDAKKKVLLLDECDSLITSRSQVGMIIGSEINTLLTEIEKFEGVCILTTNRIETLDEALERRIALIVEFPNPNFEARVGIWKRLLPAKMPLGKDVKVNVLAEFSLTGGQIKNVILQAARMAVANNQSKVGLEHFDAAISRVSKSKGLLGKTGRYIQIGSDKVRG